MAVCSIIYGCWFSILWLLLWLLNISLMSIQCFISSQGSFFMNILQYFMTIDLYTILWIFTCLLFSDYLPVYYFMSVFPQYFMTIQLFIIYDCLFGILWLLTRLLFYDYVKWLMFYDWLFSILWLTIQYFVIVFTVLCDCLFSIFVIVFPVFLWLSFRYYVVVFSVFCDWLFSILWWFFQYLVIVLSAFFVIVFLIFCDCVMFLAGLSVFVCSSFFPQLSTSTLLRIECKEHETPIIHGCVLT